MKIFLERTESNFLLTLKKSSFCKLQLDNERFNELHEESAKFFEKRTLNKELRSKQLKLKNYKYQLYEEKRNDRLIGVIQKNEIKMTWAFFCFLQQNIQDFIESEENFLNIPQKAY